VSFVLESLASRYGRPTWQRRLDPTSELILTILTQNSADTNAEIAFQLLREAYPSGLEVQVHVPGIGWGGVGLPPGAPPVYGYEAKWLWDTAEHQLEIYECPARVPDSVARDVERVALAAYHALGCRDWCRIDVRLDAQGVPNVVELNPLPGILPDPRLNSCFPKAARAAGYSYDGLIQEVVRIAWRRTTGGDVRAGSDQVTPRPALRVARSA